MVDGSNKLNKLSSALQDHSFFSGTPGKSLILPFMQTSIRWKKQEGKGGSELEPNKCGRQSGVDCQGAEKRRHASQKNLLWVTRRHGECSLIRCTKGGNQTFRGKVEMKLQYGVDTNRTESFPRRVAAWRGTEQLGSGHGVPEDKRPRGPFNAMVPNSLSVTGVPRSAHEWNRILGEANSGIEGNRIVEFRTCSDP
ncbi:hypothetical protein OG21DRAFT_1606021 [Imleria badia]|nr:hypothetical protein OG21DRAFT_1606021 [Imleria badia]